MNGLQMFFSMSAEHQIAVIIFFAIEIFVLGYGVHKFITFIYWLLNKMK